MLAIIYICMNILFYVLFLYDKFVYSIELNITNQTEIR